jgi:hypothetical protein
VSFEFKARRRAALAGICRPIEPWGSRQPAARGIAFLEPRILTNPLPGSISAFDHRTWQTGIDPTMTVVRIRNASACVDGAPDPDLRDGFGVSKIKFNGLAGLRLHIGFMRIGDQYARAHLPGTGILMRPEGQPDRIKEIADGI